MSGKSKKSKQARRQQQLAADERRPRSRLAMRPPRRQVAGPSPGTAAPSDSQTGGGTRYYLDVSAIRIQEWLGRTPSLKQWRGASAMLSNATAEKSWIPKLPDGTVWNNQAGDLAGVVSLTTQAVSSDQARQVLAAAALVVAAELRAALPHCAIRGFLGAGTFYADAYAEIQLARRRGTYVVDSPPPPPELILAMLCETCLQAPAAAGTTIMLPAGEGSKRVCRECAQRYAVPAAGRTTGTGSAVPRAEALLREALTTRWATAPEFPDDFNELAVAGAPTGVIDDVPSQVALIYADGNRVGAFLELASKTAATKGGPAKSEIVKVVFLATLNALTETVDALFHGYSRIPVMPHVADGDDLMVSVAAPHAWPFVRRLLGEFTRQLAAASRDWPAGLTMTLPSMSAGLVFHHRAHPFSDVVRLAKDRLSTAKAVQGGGAAIDFIDVTADGGLVANRTPRTLSDLDAKQVFLGKVAEIPAAQRATLVGLCRQAAADDVAPPRPAAGAEPTEKAAEALARRLVDLDAEPLWRMINAATPGQVRDAVVGLDGARHRTELRAALDLARWWPASRSGLPDLIGASR